MVSPEKMNRDELDAWAKEQGLAEPTAYETKAEVLAAVEELDTTGREGKDRRKADRDATQATVSREPVAPFPPEPEPFATADGKVAPGLRVVANDGSRDRVGTVIAQDQRGTWSVRLDSTQEVIYTRKVKPLA